MWENVGIDLTPFFFTGSSNAKLDEKGRFVLPQSMRYGLVEDGKCEFVIGLGLGGCLAIYRPSTIQSILERFQEKQYIAQYQKFFTLFLSTLHEAECDKIGRISIPSILKNAVGLKREIVVAGVLDKIELWPKDVYDRNLKELLEDSSESLSGLMEDAFSLVNERTPVSV